MEFLGFGGWEIVAIFLIALIVAGPKRMIAWSYTLGKYVALLRDMWAQTATQLQREFHNAGVDIEIPKEPPTRASLNKLMIDTVNKASAPVTAPIQEAQLTVKDLMGPMTPRALNKPVSPQPGRETPAPATNGAAPAAAPAATFGAWGGADDSAPATPPPSDSAPSEDDASFGTWGGKA
jgi:Sec-independent protein translocase protein TatA